MRLPGCILAVILVSSCGGGGDCGGTGGAGMFCPEPASGFARVKGRALHSDGSPIAGKRAWVSCGDVVGVYDARTDAEGNFEVRPLYSVADTVLYPYPPRAADGSFTLSCRASVRLASNLLVVLDPLVVRFAPTSLAVVTTLAELREGAP